MKLSHIRHNIVVETLCEVHWSVNGTLDWDKRIQRLKFIIIKM